MLLLEPPPGFESFSREKTVTVYVRHLPHWRQEGATYFVTFRLADSLPKEKQEELRQMKADWIARRFAGAEPGTDLESVRKRRREWRELSRMRMEKVDAWLDLEMGSCWLRRPELAEKVAEALRFHDGKRYEIGAFVVMPNHVHLIIRPFRQALEVVLHSRKLRTARMINEALGRDGKLWQGESFDRIIRDAEHLYECVQYIGDNPRKAGLKEGESLRWIRPDWEDLGWRFDLKTPAT